MAIIFAKARLHGKGKLSVQEQHLRLQPVPPPTPAEKQRAAAWARDVERWKAVKAAKVPGDCPGTRRGRSRPRSWLAGLRAGRPGRCARHMTGLRPRCARSRWPRPCRAQTVVAWHDF